MGVAEREEEVHLPPTLDDDPGEDQKNTKKERRPTFGETEFVSEQRTEEEATHSKPLKSALKKAHKDPWASRPQRPSSWAVALLTLVGAISVTSAMPLYPRVFQTTAAADGDPIEAGSLSSTAAMLNAAAEFVSAAVLGVLSDRFGRKPFLSLALLGWLVDFAVAGMVCHDDDGLALEHGHVWIFVARIFSGLLGNPLVYLKAYIADISTPEESVHNFALLVAAIGIGFSFGPLLGALLMMQSLRLAMWVSAALQLPLLWIVYRMPESLLPEVQLQEVDCKKANPLSALYFLASSQFLACFGTMAFLDEFAVSLVNVGFIPFCMVAFGAGQGPISIILALYGLGVIFALMFVLRRLVEDSGELGATKIGYAFTGAGFFLMAAVSQLGYFWLLLPVLLVLAFGKISAASEVAIASRCVLPTEQGLLQAANGCLDIVGKFFGALVFFAVWEPTARKGYYSIIWWLAGFIMLKGIAVACRLDYVLPARYKAPIIKADEKAAAATPSVIGDASSPGDGGETSKPVQDGAQTSTVTLFWQSAGANAFGAAGASEAVAGSEARSTRVVPQVKRVRFSSELVSKHSASTWASSTWMSSSNFSAGSETERGCMGRLLARLSCQQNCLVSLTPICC